MLVPVTLFCENGALDEENRFQPPITFPAQIPLIPPISDRAFDFYNNNVKVSIQQCWEIEKETRPQSSSEFWFKQRKLRLTASNFGNIIKRKKADVSKLVNRLSTTCDSLSHLKAIRFGKENEDVASELYMQYQNSHGSPGTKVFHCGLVINPHFPWLGASPDRLVYDPNARPSTGGLEVKCIESAQGMTPLEAFKSKQAPKEGKKKSFCLKMKDGYLRLNENHNYFYQVQGQEGVSGIERFDFALLTDPGLGLNGLFVQRIHFEKTNGSLSGCQSSQSFILTTSCLLLSKITEGLRARTSPRFFGHFQSAQKELNFGMWASFYLRNAALKFFRRVTLRF